MYRNILNDGFVGKWEKNGDVCAVVWASPEIPCWQFGLQYGEIFKRQGLVEGN